MQMRLRRSRFAIRLWRRLYRRLCHRGGQCAQIHKPNTIGAGCDLCSADGQCQTGLANAAGADQCQAAVDGMAQLLGQVVQRLITTDEWGQGCG